MTFEFELADEVVVSASELKDNMIVAEGEFSKLYATDVSGDLSGYNAVALELHSPSEHKIEGHIFDAEMHIIHEMRQEFYTDQQRTKAVVSLFFEVDDNEGPNKLL